MPSFSANAIWAKVGVTAMATNSTPKPRISPIFAPNWDSS